jgi:excisionase family DNA binding protein
VEDVEHIKAEPAPRSRPKARRPAPAVDPDVDLFTISEACEILRTSRASFYRWQTQGRGPTITTLRSGAKRIKRRDLMDYMGGELVAH